MPRGAVRHARSRQGLSAGRTGVDGVRGESLPRRAPPGSGALWRGSRRIDRVVHYPDNTSTREIWGARLYSCKPQCGWYTAGARETREEASMQFGAAIFFTDYAMGPVELGRALEERGF